MIGVFALAGWPQTELAFHAKSLADKMTTNPSWDVSVSVTDGTACGRVGPRRDGAIWASADRICQAWLDGFAFKLDPHNTNKDQTAAAGDMASALLKRGPESLLDYRGEFFLLVFDRSKQALYAATDRFGIRTTYWYAASERVAICSELDPLFRLGLLPRKLDKAFLATLLRFNKCRLGEQTLFSGVEVIPPGTVLKFDLSSHGSPTSYGYYRHEFRDEEKTEQEWADEIIPALRGAVFNAVDHSEGGTALLLSGGLDSRLLLGALGEEQRKKLFLVSCGLPESDDVLLAAKVAASVCGDYRNIDLGPSDYLEFAQTGVRRNEEFDVFVQSAQIALHRSASAAASAAMGGWDLDIPLRGTYLDRDAYSLSDNASVKKLIDAKWGLFSEAGLAELLQGPVYKECGDVPDNWLGELFADTASQTPLRQYLYFIFMYEKRRLLMLRSRMLRFELETVTPFYDTRLQLLLSGIPESMKADNRLFARVLNQMAPELAAITYQRTMLPANVSVEYWGRGAEIENQREALLQEIFVKTGIRVPYTRYYSNFEDWISSDDEWKRFTAELLDSRETLITQDMVNRDALRRLLDEHRAGVRSHRARLVYLLSLELYLREYFS